MKIRTDMHVKPVEVATALDDYANQENCGHGEYDVMVKAAYYIRELENKVKKLEAEQGPVADYDKECTCSFPCGGTECGGMKPRRSRSIGGVTVGDAWLRGNPDLAYPEGHEDMTNSELKKALKTETERGQTLKGEANGY